MKTAIHPGVQVVTVTCTTCGAETRSTRPAISVEELIAASRLRARRGRCAAATGSSASSAGGQPPAHAERRLWTICVARWPGSR